MDGPMNWLAFAVAFAVVLCVLLAWHGFDAWTLRRAPRLRVLLSGGLLLLLALLAGWVSHDQSKSVLWGTLAACLISAVIGQVRWVGGKDRADTP
jgi:hypothetical protein